MPKPNPVIFHIPEFNNVRLKYGKKEKDIQYAYKELAYIFFVSDYKSPYLSYGPDMESAVAVDLFGKGKFVPDKFTREAIEKYKQLQKTTSSLLLDASRGMVYSIMKYFDDCTIKTDDAEHRKLQKLKDFDPVAIVRMLKDVEPILKTLDSLEKRVRKEESDGENKIHGGGEIGAFEDPDVMKHVYKNM